MKVNNATYKINSKDIDDIMATALEGGITYWCDCVEITGDCLGEFASDQISRGGTLMLHDAEENKWHELTLGRFLLGLKCFTEEFGLELNEDKTIDTCAMDDMDADSIVQYAIFGEIVYG